MSKDPVEELKTKLYSYLLTFTKNKLSHTLSIGGRKTVELKQLDIRNYYGLKIGECILSYDLNLSLPYFIKAVYQIYDFLPLNPSLKTYCIIDGITLESTITNFISHISRKVYCRDCGRILNDIDYIPEEEQCFACAFESLILLEKGTVDFCSICQEFTARYIKLACGHKFHRRCVSKLLKNNCPLCNREIEVTNF
jgi:hypothetical protein